MNKAVDETGVVHAHYLTEIGVCVQTYCGLRVLPSAWLKARTDNQITCVACMGRASREEGADGR